MCAVSSNPDPERPGADPRRSGQARAGSPPPSGCLVPSAPAAPGAPTAPGTIPPDASIEAPASPTLDPRPSRPVPPQAPDPDAPRPRFLRRRRAEAAAAVLPLLALFVLMPPFIGIFVHDGRTFGAPSILVFLLAVWVGRILISRRLARRLTNLDEAL